MKQLTLSILSIVAILVCHTQTSSALSAASTTALADMNKLLAEAETVHDQCKQALDGNNKLKAGVALTTLQQSGAKLTAAVIKIAGAARGIDKADFQDAQVIEAYAKFQAMRTTLIHIGYAAPTIFLSESGKSRASAMQGHFTMIEKYKEEAKKGTQRNRVLHDIGNYLGRAKRDYNAMSQDDRSCPNGQALANDLRLVEAYLKESREADAQSAANTKEGQAVCKAFKAELMTNTNLINMEGLMRLSQGLEPNRGYANLNKAAIAGWLTRIKDQKALASALGPLCTPDKVTKMESCYSSHGKPRIEGLYAKTDPVVWCSIAEKIPDLMIGEFKAFMKRDDEMRSTRRTPEELERKDGWFAEDRAVQWSNFFFVTDEEKKQAMSEYGEILAALGANMGNINPFESREKRLTELRLAVEKLAPKWELPAKGKDFYGTGIARKTVARWYKGAKVLKTAGTAGDWTISKNALGVPLYRSRFGWILFKVKGSPLCQLRTFALGEDYAGGGRYQKAKHISFSKLRWQKCS